MTGPDAERLRKILWLFFLGRGFHPDKIPDLVNETLKRVLETMNKIQAVVAYALGVARHVAAGEIAAEAAERRNSPIHPEAVAARQPDENIERRLACLERCLRKLRPADREIVIACNRSDNTGISGVSLAKKLGISDYALHTRAHRIRKFMLKPCIEKCLEKQMKRTGPNEPDPMEAAW